MKKLVFMFAAFAAISFASCGNKAEAPVEEADSTEVEATVEDSVAPDSVTPDSAATEVAPEAEAEAQA